MARFVILQTENGEIAFNKDCVSTIHNFPNGVDYDEGPLCKIVTRENRAFTIKDYTLAELLEMFNE